MMGGSAPTALKARTGLETPPGISRRARSRRSRERLGGASPPSAISAPPAARPGRGAAGGPRGGAAPAAPRRRPPAGPADAGAVHPGDSEAGLAGAEHVRYRVIADVEDLVRPEAQTPTQT